MTNLEKSGDSKEDGCYGEAHLFYLLFLTEQSKHKLSLTASVSMRIREWMKLAGTSGGHVTQPPAQAGSPTAPVSKDGDFTASPGNLRQCLVTLMVKKKKSVFTDYFMVRYTVLYMVCEGCQYKSFLQLFL